MTGKQKVGNFLLGVMALPVALLIQVTTTLPCVEVAVGYSLTQAGKGGKSFIDLYSELMTSQNFLSIAQLLYAICAVIVFSWWLRKAFGKEQGTLFRGSRFSPLLLLGIVFLVIGLQLAVTVLYDGIALVLPRAAERYEQLEEIAGFNDPSPAILLYGVLVGPIAEELIFRGVALRYFKRALPFALANLFQAVLFGVFHMNVMQGIYAGVIGLVFGYIAYRGSLMYSILTHILFNLCGFTGILALGSESPYYRFFFLPVMVLTLILGSMLFLGRLAPVRGER